MSSPQTTNKTYTIGKVKQLVDLNGDATNFKIVFNVRSKDNKPFDAVIIDQQNLDKNETLQFKQAPGILSGEILADKNAYQNYYLALRSNEPLEVSVQLQFERLPDFIPLQQDDQPIYSASDEAKPSKVKYIVLGIIVLAIAIFLYTRIDKGNNKPTMKASLLDKLKKVNIPN